MAHKDYEARPLQSPALGLTWGVYRVLNREKDHVTAICLCYDESEARRIVDLLNGGAYR